LTISSGVTSIGNYAFRNCKFTGGLSIPNTVTTIGAYAFQGCTGFTGNLTINGSTNIGAGAFKNCSNFAGSLSINNVKSIGAQAFNGCNKFTGSLTIPASCTSIDYSAFLGNTGFNNDLTINTPVNVSNDAFLGCTGFKGKLTINGPSVIGASAFYRLNFTELDLQTGNTVTTINQYAFEYHKFQSVFLPSKITYIGSDAFAYSSILVIVDFHCPSAILEQGVFYGSSDLDIIDARGL
jgi:hypothetical protein